MGCSGIETASVRPICFTVRVPRRCSGCVGSRCSGGLTVGTVGSLVAVGRTSDVYEYGTGVVVKVPRPDVPAHWAVKEVRLTAAVGELGAPAPVVLDVVKINGRDAIVFERVDGRSMWDTVLENPRSVRAWGRELAAVHRRIMSAGLPRSVPGLIERIRSKISAAIPLTGIERQQALDLLESLPRGAALLHGDLHPGNVLLSSDGPVVIDWFDASIGHPVADVVRSSILIRPLGGITDRPHLPGADRSLLEALHDSYVSASSDLLDRAGKDLRAWEAIVAASRLAENAEADDSPLVALWRDRNVGRWSPASSALSIE